MFDIGLPEKAIRPTTVVQAEFGWFKHFAGYINE